MSDQAKIPNGDTHLNKEKLKAHSKKRIVTQEDHGEDDHSDSEHEDGDELENQAVTRFKNLQAGKFYKIVSLGPKRKRNRIVAVPVTGCANCHSKMM